MQPEHQQLWQQVCAQMKGNSQRILEDGQVTVNGKTMHFVHQRKGDRPKDGYTLIFGFHGGGGVPKSTNDQQFANHKNLYGQYLPGGLVDPNKVFLTGYSAGGDGVYHMGPRMADHLAGAMMCAGHPNDVDPINLRNTPFAIHVGGQDTPYNRNKLAQKYIDKLEEYSAEYGGFPQKSKIHPDKPHWMDYAEK